MIDPTPKSAVSITLKHPFVSGMGDQIDTITMRRATRRDIKLAQRKGKDAIDQEDILFVALTGLVTEDLDKLDIADNELLTRTFRHMRDEVSE